LQEKSKDWRDDSVPVEVQCWRFLQTEKEGVILPWGVPASGPANAATAKAFTPASSRQNEPDQPSAISPTAAVLATGR
jgi:hypothetical protein